VIKRVLRPPAAISFLSARKFRFLQTFITAHKVESVFDSFLKRRPGFLCCLKVNKETTSTRFEVVSARFRENLMQISSKGNNFVTHKD